MKRTVAILGLVGLTVSLAGTAASSVAGTTAVSQRDDAPTVVVRQGNSIAGESVPEQYTRASGRVAEVVDFNSDALAGSYYADGKLFVGSTGALGDALIEKLAESLAIDVDVTRAAYSLEDLKAHAETYLKSLDESKNLVTSFGAIPDGTGFYLVSAGTPNEEQRQDLIAAASDSPVANIVVLADSEPIPGQPLFDDNRAEDSSPYYGGMGYFANSGAADGQGSPCTSAFTFRTDAIKYVLTAGHCFPKGFFDRAHVYSTYPTTLGERAANFGGKTSIGADMTSIQVNGAYHGDVALMNVEELGRAAYAQFWTGGRYGTANSAVLARTAPAIGNYICGGGVVSGTLGCVGNLQIKGVNEDFVNNGTVYLRNGDRARGDTHSECSDSGDSGGSIYVGNTAIGVISGHTDQADGSCQQRFTGAEEAIQAWGGVVLGE